MISTCRRLYWRTDKLSDSWFYCWELLLRVRMCTFGFYHSFGLAQYVRILNNTCIQKFSKIRTNLFHINISLITIMSMTQYQNWNNFESTVLFDSFGNEPMQSCSVHRVSLSLLSASSALASVYSPPSDRFDHRSFISYKYMQLFP